MMPSLDDAGGWLAVLGRAGTFASVALVCGGLTIGVRALRGVERTAPPEVASAMAYRCLAMILSGAVGAFVFAAARVIVQTLAFAAEGDALWPIAWLILQTSWGATAVTQALLGLVLCGAVMLARRWSAPIERMGEAPFVYPALALCVVPAFMGHATVDAFLAVGVTVDALHVAGASVWGGGVVVLAGFALRPSWRPVLPAVIEAFHPDAVAAVTAVMISGVVAAWRRLPDPWHPLVTSYGQVLVLKMMVVIPVLALGWWHARRAPDRLRAGTAISVTRTLGIEALLISVVFVLTAVLTGTSPEH
jgi:putative copper export protein